MSKRILVAMSGGVDSSMAASLLLEQGAEVEGVTFSVFGPDVLQGDLNSGAFDAAQQMADFFGIPLRRIHLAQLFERTVVRPFVDAYARGMTPNPCIDCNRTIKFGALVQMAKAEGFDAVATGHYARVEKTEGRYRLKKGLDPRKDQSYFLYPIAHQDLSKVCFPLGSLTKPEIRSLAEERSLPVAHRQESQEICFVPGSYVEFLEGSAGIVPTAGPIVLPDGRIIGQHDGLHRYTIGQRRGLGIGWTQVLYVLERRTATNELVVGPQEALTCNWVRASRANWTSGRRPETGEVVQARIRYNSPAVTATVAHSGAEEFCVSLQSPVQGIASGQAAVLYQGDEVLGGGVIEEAGVR